MVSTRSGGAAKTTHAEAGKKRSSSSTVGKKPPSKKAKKNDEATEEEGEGESGAEEMQGELKAGDDGQMGLKEEGEKEEGSVEEEDENVPGKAENGKAVEEQVKGEGNNGKENDDERPEKQTGSKASKKAKDEVEVDETPKGDLYEPKHGTLEKGHIYFLYRPKIDADEVESVDDISKFHMLLLPKSKDKGYYHRIIEVGKKKMPDPGAKHQVIWGLVGGVGNDRRRLKETFGGYSYETKTRGTRHQPPARPAARGHYILHSPRDPLADDPSRKRQRDFKLLLAYSITTPSGDDFGRVQEELGLAYENAVIIQVKDPNVESTNNPRAAGIPREKRAQYPKELQNLFSGRRFIPANPPSFLDYTGTELLIISSPHKISESLGAEGDKIEGELEKDAEKEAVGAKDALKELGLSEKDTEIEALEGEWA